MNAPRSTTSDRGHDEREEHDRALRKGDETAAAKLEERESKIARELAPQEQAESEAQAEAIARALRRP